MTEIISGTLVKKTSCDFHQKKTVQMASNINYAQVVY